MNQKLKKLAGVGIGAAAAYTAYNGLLKKRNAAKVDNVGAVPGSGETVLITGASGGLGKAFAEIFAKNGFDLVLVARSLDKMEKIAEDLKERYGVKVTCINEDLSDPNGAQKVYDRVKEKNIQIDQLVNNAGAGHMSRVIDADPQDIKDLINLNCTSVTLLCTLFGADMEAHGKGRIMNVSSLGAIMPDPYFNVYGPSKAFEHRLTQCMYGEMRGNNVTVTVLLSGPIQTNWANNAGKADSSMAADPMVVAEEGFEAMQKGRLVITATPLYKATAAAVNFIPDRQIAKLVGKWQNGLIQEKNRRL